MMTTPSSLPTGEPGKHYSQTLTASGGKPPYKFSVVGGKLPEGLSLGSAIGPEAIISGEPRGPGSTFVVKVTDSDLKTSTKTFSVAINRPPPHITTSSPLPYGTYEVPYSQFVTASGGKPPYTFSLTSGLLPSGLTLKGNGTLEGTPKGVSTSTFDIKVTDSNSASDTKLFKLTIIAGPTITTPNNLPGGAVGVAYSLKFTATGGTPPYTWFRVGPLPAGLDIIGPTLSGTPSQVGTSLLLKIGVKDVNGAEVTKNFYLNIASAPSITTPSPLPDAFTGNAYKQTFEAGGGKDPYSFSLENGALPPGLSLQGAVLSGIATTPGTSTFTIKVTDANGAKRTKGFFLTVKSPPVITTPSPLPSGEVGLSYHSAFFAEQGIKPYKFEVVSGTLPAGLALTGATLTGSPTTASTSTFTIRVTDSASVSSTKNFSITIVAANAPLPTTMTSNALKVVGIGVEVSDPNAPPLPASITSGALKVMGIGAEVWDPNAPTLPSSITSGPLKVVGPGP
jgi:hypothetical protein